MSIPSKIGITIILSLGIVLLIGWSSAASQGQKPNWKGKIVTETGFLSALRAAEKLPTVVLQESLRIAEQPGGPSAAMSVIRTHDGESFWD